MRIATLLAPEASNRIAEALGRSAKILFARDARELVALLARRPSSAAVDPSCVGAESVDAVVRALSDGGTPFVIYVPLSADQMAVALPFARAGAWAIVTPGFSDGPDQLRHVFRGLSQQGLAGMLLERIGPSLDRVPPALGRAVSDLFFDAGRAASPALLARNTGLTRRSVDRWLQRAGLASASRLIAAAHLVNAYGDIRGSSKTIRAVAQSLGYSSRRPLDRQVQTLLGMTLESFREGTPAEVVVDALADRLLTGPYDRAEGISAA